MFSFSYKRSMKAKTLASAQAVRFAVDKTIDPALLFQRFFVVSQIELHIQMHHPYCPRIEDIVRQKASY